MRLLPRIKDLSRILAEFYFTSRANLLDENRVGKNRSSNLVENVRKASRCEQVDGNVHARMKVVAIRPEFRVFNRQAGEKCLIQCHNHAPLFHFEALR